MTAKPRLLPAAVLVAVALASSSCSNVTESRPASRPPAEAATTMPASAEVLAGLQSFYKRTAHPDGSFQPGIDPDYIGMSDSAASDLAPVTYACTIHRTFGWRLPFEEQTVAFLQSRQRPGGEFFNVKGTLDTGAEGRTYNTTQGLVALHALGVRPQYDPLPVFEEVLRQDYKTLPAFSTSFFPLAYLCAGHPIPPKADQGIRALMVQDETGYTNDHVAATFHASHYYNLVGEPTPKARQMVDRILRDQRPDGSWMLNMPSRDRHATFDAVFTLLHEGGDRADCRAAIQRAARWALSCRNPDGGFGHFPGSTSDADAVYFQVGTLVMAGYLKPADPLPPDPHLLSWGHLMPVHKPSANDPVRLDVGAWVGAVAFSHDGTSVATGSSDGVVRIWDPRTGKLQRKLEGHADPISAAAFSPDDALLATGSLDRTVRVWDMKTGRPLHTLTGHRGAVMTVAFAPVPSDPPLLASASVDGTIRLWDARTGQPRRTLEGHQSWVNSIGFSADGATLVSGSSDGTVKLWGVATGERRKTIPASKAEVRCVAISPDSTLIAAGLRYGSIQLWSTPDWNERPLIKGLAGDVWSLAFTPDGRLVSGSGDWNLPGQVTFWDPATGKQIKQLNHSGEVLSIAMSPKTHQIAAGGGDGAVTIWTYAPRAAKE